MRRIGIAGIVLFLVWAASRATLEEGLATGPAFAATAPVAPTPAAPPLMPMAVSAPIDSFAAERDSMMNEVLKSIAGRESAPAESVFKKIELMKGMPAGRLVRIMNLGYGKSLGVRCTHCHDSGKWESEDKPQKQIARDMAAMMRTVNSELLPKIKNLRSEKPGVNCTTCHRGSIKPAQNL